MRRVRRSLEKGELNTLLDELDEWNTNLRICFEKMELPSAEPAEDRTMKGLNARFDIRKCQAVVRNAQLLHETLEKSWNCRCTSIHKSSLRLSWHTAKFLTPKEFEVAMSYEKSLDSVSSETWKRIRAVFDEPNRPITSQATPVQVTTSLSADTRTKVDSRKVRFHSRIFNSKTAPASIQGPVSCKLSVWNDLIRSAK